MMIAWDDKNKKPILKDGNNIVIDQETGIGSDGVSYIDKYVKITNGKRVTIKQYSLIVTPLESAIRTISKGAMQRRFTIEEEVFISSDAAATVIKSRLFNSSFCNLDFQDTIDGVTYICGVLKVGGIITDEAARIAKLLIDGTEAERYP